MLLDVELSEGGVASLAQGSTGACNTPLTCGNIFSSRLPPVVHSLSVAELWQGLDDRPIALRIRLDGGSCAATLNDRLDTAIDLDVTLGQQRIVGNTACGQQDFAACSEDRGAPDLFYRLDLRGFSAPRYVSLEGVAGTNLRAYVLRAAPDGTLTHSSQCDYATRGEYIDLYGVLAPRLYYLMIGGYAQSAGRFDLLLNLTEAYPVPRQCFPRLPSYSTDCRQDSEPACATSLAHPSCLQAALDCGLAPDVYTVFCAAATGCCDGTLAPEACLDAWLAASTCPD
jgi:hypothetical protein